MHLARLVKPNDRSRGPGQPDWSVLLQPTTWLAAAAQVVFSLQLGLGALTTYASYNKYEHNLVRDTAIMAVAHLVWLLLAVLLTFALLDLAEWAGELPGAAGSGVRREGHRPHVPDHPPPATLAPSTSPAPKSPSPPSPS